MKQGTSASSVKSGKLQIPILIKPIVEKPEVPFEKYQHFVICPARPPEESKAQLISTRSIKEEISHLKSTKDIFIEDEVVEEEKAQLKMTMTPFEVHSSQDELDQYILEAYAHGICVTTENFLKKKFDAQTVIYWDYVPELEILYSNTNKLIAHKNEGLAYYTLGYQSILMTNAPTIHSAFSPKVDRLFIPGDVPFIAFPIRDYRNNYSGVIEIIRPFGAQEFTEIDEEYIVKFAIKLQTYGKFLLSQPLTEHEIIDIVTLQHTDVLIKKCLAKISKYFACREPEIWKFEFSNSTFTRLNDNKQFSLADAGIVGSVIDNCHVINYITNLNHPSYNNKIDGTLPQPILVAPVKYQDKIFAVVLRTCAARLIFTPEDEGAALKIASFVGMALTNCEIFTSLDTEIKSLRDRSESLAALLAVAEALSGQLDIDKLTALIMEKGRSLTQSDRCSLFLVSKDKDRLVTSFQDGLANAIDIPIDKGIAGKTVKQRQTINLEDAYEDPAFDPSVDLETGYQTKSILSVPIINNRNEVIGVTEMVNKKDRKPFTVWDQQMIQIFNVFCAISLENSRLYSESINMSHQLRSFFDVAFSLSKKESIHRILGDIIKNARGVINAECASLFLFDASAGVLTSYLVDGGKLPPTLPLSTGIAGSCAKTKEFLLVNNAYDDPRFNRTVDIENNFKTKSILVGPIISSDNEVLGVVEMVNKKDPNGFTNKDMEMLQSFATFSAVSLENERLKSIAELGTAEVELPKYISESERKKFKTIPAKLQLDEESQKKANSLNFFCIEWNGAPQIRLLFYLFNKFKILENFQIPNEVFFRFLFEIRSQYHDVPYHNWTHACDVTQYVAYQLVTSKLYEKMTDLELFAMMVSAVCHDAGHDGFNNIYNVKAETPLGILFKDQSVMETHHCTVTINVMSKDEFNLMRNLQLDDSKKMWNMMIALILATDMAFHFKLVKESSALVDEGKFSLEDPQCRLLAFKLILKVADISNVSRPFVLADKWCDVLCEEFFRQGDNEKSHGIELTSPLNDREHPNKPKSQIGFYNFICIPLYQVVSRVFPELEVNLKSVQANLEVWKSLVEEQ